MFTIPMRFSDISRRVVATVLLMFLALPTPLVARNFDTPWTPVEPVGPLLSMSRYDRLRIASVAPGGPLDEAFILKQKAEGYNALNVSDTEDFDPVRRRYPRVSPEKVAGWFALADKYDMSLFVCIALAEPIPDEVHSDGVTANATTERRSISLFNARMSRTHTQRKSVATQAVPGHTMLYLSDEEVRERFNLWARYDTGQVVATYLFGDDPFFQEIPAETQERWTAIGAEVAPDLPLATMAGEFAIRMTPEQRAKFWTTKGYDILLLIDYAKNLGHTWGFPVNHLLAEDADAQMALYQRTYMPLMRQVLFPVCGRVPLFVLPVIETFYYEGTDPGFIPRTRDIELQVRLVHEQLQTTFGQRDNFSMGYFWAGMTPDLGLHGINNVPGWAETVQAQNAWLHARYIRSLRPYGGLR